MKNTDIKNIIREDYSKIAKGCGCCSCNAEKIATQIGYSQKDIKIAPEANLGLGCGNPTALANIKEGHVVLDLGSGAGFDAFLASKKVGNEGKVIGVDMTPEMIEKANNLAKKYNYLNVEFKLGEIENLPIEDKSIDIVISNCVINLAPDKDKVFKEIYRVLKKQGKIYISDIVLLEKLPENLKNNKKLLSGCVAGALLKEDYIKKIDNAGFKIKILSENKNISKEQYNGINLESIKIEGVKK